MKSMLKWPALTIALVLTGCIGDPTCEDLATCPLEASFSQPTDDGESSESDGGAGMAAEDCMNDEDDDGDGKTDCADSDCKANSICVDQLPLDFDGFAVISISSIDAPSPTCADGSAAVTLYQNPNEQICDACTCDASSVSCSGPDVALDFQTAMCTSPDFVFNPGVDECVSIDLFNLGIFEVLQSVATIGDGQVAAGNCTAAGGAPIASPAMKTKVSACAVKHPSKVVVGNDEHLCMYANSHLPVCPAGWSAISTNAFTGYVDERQGCTPCGCIAGCSGGEYEVFEQSGCSGEGVIVGAGGACAAINPTVDFSIMGKAPAGTCTLKGGEPIGKVIPTGEKTFCCKS
ncbi:MAG: hypothetical protein IPM54_25215 [Polyangiaceae bacterium]|nr:hypothetical protein [Polyangiaceae bacterium]